MQLLKRQRGWGGVVVVGRKASFSHGFTASNTSTDPTALRSDASSRPMYGTIPRLAAKLLFDLSGSGGAFLIVTVSKFNPKRSRRQKGGQ